MNDQELKQLNEKAEKLQRAARRALIWAVASVVCALVAVAANGIILLHKLGYL